MSPLLLARAERPRLAQTPARTGRQHRQTRPVPFRRQALTADRLGPGEVLHLQQTAGNGAVLQLLLNVQRGKKTRTARTTKRATAGATQSKTRKRTRRTTPRSARTTKPAPLTSDLRKKMEKAAVRQARLIRDLTTLYVVEAFDDDGTPTAQPDHAYASEQPGTVQVIRERGFIGPRTGGRNPTPRADYPATYQSRYFTYVIDLVNTAVGSPLPTRSGVDTDEPFDIRRRTLKGSGRAQGRPNRLREHWAHNPAYWQPHGGLAAHQSEAAGRAKAHELNPVEEISAADVPAGLVALPSDATQPYIFYVSATERDPNFTHDARRYARSADFDSARPVTGKMQQGLSDRPVENRRDAGRLPAATMGNTQAYEYMDTNRGAIRGARLASHEWCHLIGDGDGGPDALENLVIGTNAVNTEQLAMELALRDYRFQLAALSCAIQLTVKVITRDAPVPVVRGYGHGRGNVADWISYDIAVVNSQDKNDTRRIPAHRQIMDGTRGTITRAEFSYLHHTVREKLRRVVDHLQQARAAGKYRQVAPGQIVFADEVMAFTV